MLSRCRAACLIALATVVAGCTTYGGKTYPVKIDSEQGATVYAVRRSAWDRAGGADAFARGGIPGNPNPLPQRADGVQHLEAIEYMAVAEVVGSDGVRRRGWTGPFTPSRGQQVEVVVPVK